MKPLLNIATTDIAEKVREQQKRKTKTGMSIQATVNQALIKRMPQNNPAGGMIEQPATNNGWGATK